MANVMIILISGNEQEGVQASTSDRYEKLWKAEQTADYLNTDVDTIYELARTGVLPSIPLSKRRVRFEPSVIRQWVKNGGKIEKLPLQLAIG